METIQNIWSGRVKHSLSLELAVSTRQLPGSLWQLLTDKHNYGKGQVDCKVSRVWLLCWESYTRQLAVVHITLKTKRVHHVCELIGGFLLRIDSEINETCYTLPIVLANILLFDEYADAHPAYTAFLERSKQTNCAIQTLTLNLDI